MLKFNIAIIKSVVILWLAKFLDGEFVDPNYKIVSVHQPTGQFLDSAGRTRWFHGTNIVSKSEPYYPPNGDSSVCNHTMSNTLCDEDMDYMQELGINSLRLGVMWPGAEPERGVFDDNYFNVIHTIIQKLAQRGIYTLVDVHQDVFAKQFCGEGVPDWFVKTDWITAPELRFPVPQKNESFQVDDVTGLPSPPEQCWEIGEDWFLSYFTFAVGNAFQRLYDNYDNLGDAFCNYWNQLAIQFGNYSSVMGYDLLNEPWAGDIYDDPTLLVPGVAAKKNLQPLWEKCNTRIREVDTETIVFFESVTWDIFDGHTEVPGKNGSKTAMSYHYYSPPQGGLKQFYKHRIEDQRRLETGGILSEFRMWEGDSTIMRNMKETIDLADENLQSWMGWAFSTDRQTNLEIEKHYARTYAPAVAGIVKSIGFNEITGEYKLTWTSNTDIKAPTEIKINPRLYYLNGYTIEITPSNMATWSNQNSRNLEVRYTENAVNGQDITLKIIANYEESSSTSTEPNNYNGASNLKFEFKSYSSWLLLFVFLFPKFNR